LILTIVGGVGISPTGGIPGSPGGGNGGGRIPDITIIHIELFLHKDDTTGKSNNSK